MRDVIEAHLIGDGTYAGGAGHRMPAEEQDQAGFPLYNVIPKYEVVLEPGDVLYSPQWWWHTVDNLGESIGVAMRFRTGMFASNLIMFFIILTTAATLHAHGVVKIDTAKQAAEALRPLAGNAAYLLFTLGLIGTGMLGVPVLAGSCAYAISEAAAWRGSLEKKPRGARKFYTVLGVAMVLGLVINFAGLDAVKMLFWSAVTNGVLAPPLILLILLLTSDPNIMGSRVSSRTERTFGWLTFVLMTGAAAAMLVA